MLIAAALAAPLLGTKPERPDLAHRVNADGLAPAYWEQADWARSVCGELVKLHERDGEPVGWSQLRTRGTPVVRCPDCRTWRKP